MDRDAFDAAVAVSSISPASLPISLCSIWDKDFYSHELWERGVTTGDSMEYLCFLVAFLACIIGKICGMGGGIIIKPVLDTMGQMGHAAINFVSGCTVLGMTSWSVGKSLVSGKSDIDIKKTTPLAVGAAIGGLVGKYLFNSCLMPYFNDGDIVAGIQAAVLFTLTFLTLIYTLRKDTIRSLKFDSMLASVGIGMVLGMLGSFLGIGGGPFNMAVLYLFFSMSTKIAVQNSLYIILFSQTLSLVQTVLAGEVPEVSFLLLLGMVLFGIVGSEIGRLISKKLSDHSVTVLFELSIVLVMIINIFNMYRFFT